MKIFEKKSFFKDPRLIFEISTVLILFKQLRISVRNRIFTVDLIFVNN